MARAETNLMLDYPTAALKDCNQAIKFAPNFAPAYFVRALVKLRSNKAMLAASDANRSANLFKAEGNLERYQDCLDLLKEIQLPSQTE